MVVHCFGRPFGALLVAAKSITPLWMITHTERYARRQAWLAKNPNYLRIWKSENRERTKSYRKNFRAALCARARLRGRARGLEATIKPSDLIWPTHCPVLGIELDYPQWSGERGRQPAQANWPSLDRWDSTGGYVPGNVFVISYRANTLKNSANYEEMLLVAKYLAKRPSP